MKDKVESLKSECIQKAELLLFKKNPTVADKIELAILQRIIIKLIKLLQ